MAVLFAALLALGVLAISGVARKRLLRYWRSSRRGFDRLIQFSSLGKDMTPSHMLQQISELEEPNETASLLADLIHEDGAGSWPPRANYDLSTWPGPLRGYAETFRDMAQLLSTTTPSLDDGCNRARIERFRLEFRRLLRDRIDQVKVRTLLAAAKTGQWELFPRDVYNAFYSCVAMSRHIYRQATPKAWHFPALIHGYTSWGTIPVVKEAQLEKAVDLPPELVEPWTSLQERFGCISESGNAMSNLVLCFDTSERFICRVNTGVESETIHRSEESFARIFRDIEGIVGSTPPFIASCAIGLLG